MSDRVIVGTPIKLTLDGIVFFPTADSDPGNGKPRYKTEAEESSGRTFFKKTVQNQSISSMSVRVTSNELEQLQELAKRLEPFPMSYTNAAEDTYKAQGMIDFEERKSQTGVVDLTLYPNEKGWVLF
ncbi:MAG: hypothetical protein LBH43_17980 [Treponema sp.]|jgi:hypothetical protein|nr:hypothetical protein [Treponema sp.]